MSYKLLKEDGDVLLKEDSDALKLELETAFKAVAGTLTSAGSLIKDTYKNVAGTLTSAGATIKETAKDVLGTLTSGGAVTTALIFVKAVVGALSSSGLVGRKRIAGGWVSPTGHNDPNNHWSYGAKAYDNDTGTYAESAYVTGWQTFLELTINAVLCSKLRHWEIGFGHEDECDLDAYYNDGGGAAWHHVYQGALNNDKHDWTERELGGTYSVTKLRWRTHTSSQGKCSAHEFDFWEVDATIFKSLAGTLSSSATLVTIHTIFKVMAGTLTSAGALTLAHIYHKVMAGVLTLAGALSKAIAVTKQACAGTLTSAGSLTRNIYLNVTGTLTSAGSSIKNISGIVLTGSLTLAGAILRNITQGVSGVLTSAGALATALTFPVAMAGVLTSAGAILKDVSKYIVGTVTSAGVVTKWTRMLPSGTVTLTGTVVKSISKGVAGILGFVGKLTPWKYGPPITCALSFDEELDATLSMTEELEVTLEMKEGA